MLTTRRKGGIVTTIKSNIKYKSIFYIESILYGTGV